MSELVIDKVMTSVAGALSFQMKVVASIIAQTTRVYPNNLRSHDQ